MTATGVERSSRAVTGFMGGREPLAGRLDTECGGIAIGCAGGVTAIIKIRSSVRPSPPQWANAYGPTDAASNDARLAAGGAEGRWR
ncbi:MAG: hypothetical protein ABS79_00215 [Planctomycetes bacterium SCN 63-9]|nr:MAG: hypothetical protein ABS79_00215 [Planctomycetes bacterium SCN 63-9]